MQRADERRSEPPALPKEKLATTRQSLRRRARSALPFVAGMLAALAALVLYNVFFPAPQPLTMHEVNEYCCRGTGCGHTTTSPILRLSMR